jgi:DNA-directed RNA polymerase subunit RPC12/RpoP
MTISEAHLREIIRSESQRVAPSPTPTESHADHVCGCKDCFCDTVKKLDREASYECEDCHLPLPDSMIKDPSSLCPLCGGKHAQKRTNTPLKR